jgi:hypothetical protein
MSKLALDSTSKVEAPACEVDLASGKIRFQGCKDHGAMTSAAEGRITALSGQIVAPKSRLTNRRRKELNRERNFLRKWRSTWHRGSMPFVEKSLRGLDTASPVVISFQPDSGWSYQV